MGQPAARLGDPTAHGGAITSGNPTVLIGGQPAATMGDLHVCPMCSPGPHVGGPVMAGAPTVLIGGRPAARLGDPCTCAAPAPDAILAGCPTVLIGGASAAASPGAAAALASAHGATARPGTPGLGTAARPLSPWVGVGYVDPAGRPVTGWHYHAEGERQRDGQVGTGGQVWLDALAGSGAVDVGLVGVYGCRWAKGEARVGEAVGMSARCVGVEDGELALFEVWQETASATGAASRSKVWEVVGEVAGGRVEAAAPFVSARRNASGTLDADADEAEGIAGGPPPVPDLLTGGGRQTAKTDSAAIWVHYVAEVTVGGLHRARSGALRFEAQIELPVIDADDAAVPGAEVTLTLSSGEIRRVTADADGVLRASDLPEGPYTVGDVSVPPTSQQTKG